MGKCGHLVTKIVIWCNGHSAANEKQPIIMLGILQTLKYGSTSEDGIWKSLYVTIAERTGKI